MRRLWTGYKTFTSAAIYRYHKYFLLVFGQLKSGFIFFYKPYTHSFEPNLYKNTIVKFDYKVQYENLKNANINDDVDRAKNND